MTTNGPSVDSLAGWNVPIGASIAGLVLSAGEEWTFGKDPKTDELVVGHVLTLGQGGNLGAPLPPAEVHVGVTRTWLLPNRHNLFDMFSLSRPKVR